MDQRAAGKAAELLWQAWLAGNRIDDLPDDCSPLTLDDGYKIQDAMAAGTGRAVLGWKLAVTSAAGQRRLGLSEPLAGRLFEGFVLDDGARITAGQMKMRVLEGEFAFRLGRSLPPRVDAYENEEIMAAIADLHLAIEVPDCRFELSTEVNAPGIVADNGFAAWFILGPKVTGWRNLDLPAFAVRAISNGGVSGESSNPNTLGDPLLALYWLARDRAKRGEGLKAGDIITTGTRFAPVAFLPGDHATVEFAGLGKVGTIFD
jgi:2-keto-4-pentenoate hydratase